MATSNKWLRPPRGRSPPSNSPKPRGSKPLLTGDDRFEAFFFELSHQIASPLFVPERPHLHAV